MDCLALRLDPQVWDGGFEGEEKGSSEARLKPADQIGLAPAVPGPRTLCRQLDVASPSSIAALAEGLKPDFPHINVRLAAALFAALGCPLLLPRSAGASMVVRRPVALPHTLPPTPSMHSAQPPCPCIAALQAVWNNAGVLEELRPFEEVTPQELMGVFQVVGCNAFEVLFPEPSVPPVCGP